MESLAPKPSRLDLHHPHGTFTPPPLKRILPLRIVKRPESCCDLGRRDDVDDSSPRTCSQGTDDSRGSAPEPPDGEQQLTIAKIRGSRSSRVFGSLDDVDEDPVPLGRDPYLAKDFGGFRDRYFMSPRSGISPPYRPIPGLLGDIIQRSRTSHDLLHGHSDARLTTHRAGDELEALTILVPDVRVTPDTKFVDYGYHNFWVAIEIESKGDYGSLYDIKVDVEATAHSSVLEVIENYAAPSTLAHGSRLLVLANVELRLPNYSRLVGHIRSQSDELMEDLEHQLGSAACDYLRVNLVYRHTAFPSTPDAGADPDQDGAGDDDDNTGVTRSHTKIRSAFTASITRHDSASPWSPPPAHAPAPNRLVGIVAAHWGLHAADELLQTKLARRKTVAPRRTTYVVRPGGGGGVGNHDSNSYRHVDHHDGIKNRNNNGSSLMSSPTRRGREPAMSSLRRGAPPPPPPPMVVDENRRGRENGIERERPSGSDTGDDSDGVDTAPRIWARLRRCSGMSSSHNHNKNDSSYRGAAVNGGGGGSKTSLTDVTNHQAAGSVGEMLDRRRGGMIRKASGGGGGGGKGWRVGSSGRWGFGNWWAS